MQTKIISLDDLIATDATISGSKAANLAKLRQNGIEVPNGIIVPFSFFEEYCQTSDLPLAYIDDILSQELSTKVAVRSSADVEDSLRKSFAGQFTTKLEVPLTNSSLSAAIQECYDSAREYDCNEYMKSTDRTGIKMGLLIQDMVQDPICSGVVFTLDPTNGNRNRIVINCKEGLGDDLVSGEVSGETYKFSKSGTLPDNDSELLTSEQIRELVEISKKIESQFGVPQDIEFSFSNDGNLYIIQSRPITSFSLDTYQVIKQEEANFRKIIGREKDIFGLETIFSNSNIVENFPEPTPMGLGIFNYIFTGSKEFPGAIQIGRNDLGYACSKETYQNQLNQMISGKPFMDFIVDALTFRLEGIDLSDYLNVFVADYLQKVRDDPSLGNYPEGGLYVQHPPLEFLIEHFGEKKGKSYHRIYKRFHQDIKNFEKEFHERFSAELEPSIDKFYREELSNDLDSLSKKEIIRKFSEYLDILRTEACVDFVKVARLAFFGYDRLRNDVENLMEKYGLSFFEDVLSDIVADQKLDFSAMDKPKITKLSLDILLQAKPETIINETERLEETLSAMESGEISVDEFLSKYGHVGQLEISLPRYAEERDYFESLQSQSGNNIETSKERKGLLFRQRLVEKLQAIGESPDEISDFVHNAEMANIYLPLRETAKMSYLKVHYLAKRCLVALSKKCGLEGKEIYLLEPNEVSMLVESFDEAFQLIKYREALSDAHKEIDIPPLIFADTQLKRMEFGQNNTNNISIPGEIVRMGVGKGITLVARTNIELVKKYNQYMGEGITDIVGVFPAMDPSYGTRSRFSGLITQFGGTLAHAAIIARDQKIPYLTNVAITKIPDKTEVIVDGTEGMVYITK